MRAVILPNVSKWRQEAMKMKARYILQTMLEKKRMSWNDIRDGVRKNEILVRKLVTFDRNSGTEQLLRPFRCWL
jgi:hypothetical protein